MTSPGPVVGVVGGSRSDFPVLEKAVEVLEGLGVPNELRVVSAHRSPDHLYRYANLCEMIEHRIGSARQRQRAFVERHTLHVMTACQQQIAAAGWNRACHAGPQRAETRRRHRQHRELARRSGLH